LGSLKVRTSFSGIVINLTSYLLSLYGLDQEPVPPHKSRIILFEFSILALLSKIEKDINSYLEQYPSP
jgi:hypothetical protein